MSKIEEKVEGLVKKRIENIGYELYDVLYIKEGKDKILRIVIDKENRNNIRRLWKSKQWNKRYNRPRRPNKRAILFRSIITRDRKNIKKRLAIKKIHRRRSRNKII